MARDLIWWAGIARDTIPFAVVAGVGIRLWFRKRSSRHWPITFGKVESASTYQDNFKWLTDVSYSYSVESNFYSGQFQLRCLSERKANDQELRWHGRTITVRLSEVRNLYVFQLGMESLHYGFAAGQFFHEQVQEARLHRV
jgi:hypothetical protein